MMVKVMHALSEVTPPAYGHRTGKPCPPPQTDIACAAQRADPCPPRHGAPGAPPLPGPAGGARGRRPLQPDCGRLGRCTDCRCGGLPRGHRVQPVVDRRSANGILYRLAAGLLAHCTSAYLLPRHDTYCISDDCATPTVWFWSRLLTDVWKHGIHVFLRCLTHSAGSQAAEVRFIAALSSCSLSPLSYERVSPGSQVMCRRFILSRGYDTSYRCLARRAAKTNNWLNRFVRRGSVARRVCAYGALA